VKNLKFLFIGIIIAAVITVTLLSMNLSYVDKNNTDKISTMIFPGSLPEQHCPIGDSPLIGSIINFTGMNVYDIGNVKIFVIAPGQHGQIIYELTRGNYQPLTGFSSRQFLNITNVEIFYHKENSSLSTTHEGITVSFMPQSEVLQYNSSSTIKADIAIDSNALVGTYWFTFHPGPCFGPNMSLITIGDKPYNLSLH